ncbi:N-formylglutamate amidohydrolase [Plantactinospora sp. BB1]|uniref:N-formylglutamate amidohydrolase n=1 Tax=Plantactinospora sp. BB1 TaxID=2071627 RepID=UPI000D1647C9|nr:N-formylglutamate amidohydrolase [Plantactinospora sp. BB1]AVT37881.1 N-formylglutamate amidohydrolase [Plantactinospora sp. BB1]
MRRRWLVRHGGSEGSAGFRVVPGAADSEVVLHVPHAGRLIPPEVRAELLLDDAALAAELARMTDAHTDLIAARAAGSARCTPWTFVNLLSRLVVDPERFPDERESMRAVGMAAVYTRTSDGSRLRADDPVAEERLLDRWYRPYARAVTELVAARLAARGRVTLLDVHSYPSRRLPYEIGGTERPAVCLGTDPAHTPGWLLAAGRAAFAGFGDTGVDTPFAGCYVPLRYYGRDRRVTALMVEIRRDGYLVEPGGPPTDGLAALAGALATLVDAVDAGTDRHRRV